jgi:hypothetical protein
MMASVSKAKELLLSNPPTIGYFQLSEYGDELMHQVDIYFDFKGVECKALLDGIRINHIDKTIQPFDLKTTGKSVLDFPDSFLSFGYYRQCAFYEQALLSGQSPIKHLLEEGYKLLDFVFIVAETNVKSTRSAIIFVTSPNDRLAGLKGGKIGTRTYPGIEGLLDDYLWHSSNDYWDMPKYLFDSGGVIKLDVFDGVQ